MVICFGCPCDWGSDRVCCFKWSIHELFKKGSHPSPKTEFIERLNIISQELTKIIKNKKPDVIAVEKLFFNKNVKSALEVGHARGVILLTASQNKIPLREFTPSEIKQSLTGHGAADKQQVQTMTKCVLGMPEEPKPDHAADALATACTAP